MWSRDRKQETFCVVACLSTASERSIPPSTGTSPLFDKCEEGWPMTLLESNLTLPYHWLLPYFFISTDKVLWSHQRASRRMRTSTQTMRTRNISHEPYPHKIMPSCPICPRTPRTLSLLDGIAGCMTLRSPPDGLTKQLHPSGHQFSSSLSLWELHV